MRELNYRLIVSDFDGTLLNDEHQIPEKVKRAITEYTANGGLFAVCTGRMLCCILPHVRSLGLKGFVVAHQGNVIAEIESGKVLKSVGMDYRDVANICSHIEDLGYDANVYCDDNMYTTIPKDTDYLQLYERIVGIDSIFVSGKISEYTLNNKLCCQKVAVLIEPDKRDWLYIELKKRLKDKFDVTCSTKVLVEISSPTENKGTGLKFIADKFNIPLKLTCGVGDSLNDITLLETAGLGIAVGNAEPELKKRAQFVSISNNEGAMAQIIEKFGFA